MLVNKAFKKIKKVIISRKVNWFHKLLLFEM
jgi:hypothetical protein